jgi:hypothetical protein
MGGSNVVNQALGKSGAIYIDVTVEPDNRSDKYNAKVTKSEVALTPENQMFSH